MSRIICLFGILLFSLSLSAQLSEGVVIYERKLNMHRRIQDEQMKSMIPEFRTSKHQLVFTDSVSVYKAVPEEEMPDGFNTEGGGARFTFRAGPGENAELFRHFASARSVESREMGAKTFLIEDSIKNRSWKLTGETKTILGYRCRKAVSTETSLAGGNMRIIRSGAAGNNAAEADTANRPKPRQVTVEAWFAEGINVPAGPESFGMLPGLILELNVDNGFMVFEAVELKKEVNGKDLKEPKKGKRITRAEFMKMQAEMMGGGGMRMIRM